MKKKILVALDDSINSFLSLDYTAHLFADQHDIEICILHCDSSSRCFAEPENPQHSLIPDRPLSKQALKGSRLLEKAHQKLIDLKLPAERISRIHHRAATIATSIQQVAEQNLVDSLVIARRGVGFVGELLMGSVSSTLFDSCHSIPLWIIDGEIKSKKFLVPVDGTPSSLMAIDHLSHIFAGRDDLCFYLFHARGYLSPPPACRPEDFYDKWGKDWCDANLSGNGCMFTGPTDLLTEAGIPPKCIITLPQPKALEESSAIISSARKNDCGTIVIGRRPARESKGFLGGVARRTIMQTEDLALWVVG
ncbi:MULTISPECIES: universal stress protein [Desulfosediminicola]|uniref:universal stress protein n=1 Tax=Desulfosediminicola TaxID=2886823 RepID=UPI0010ACE8E4|nr:universal stress protein [Desulfosediminicola ganghwensis]